MEPLRQANMVLRLRNKDGANLRLANMVLLLPVSTARHLKAITVLLRQVHTALPRQASTVLLRQDSMVLLLLANTAHQQCHLQATISDSARRSTYHALPMIYVQR